MTSRALTPMMSYSENHNARDPSPNDLDYRLRSFAVAGACAVDGNALSMETSQAMVSALVDEVNAVIAAGKSEAAMINDFAGLFDKYSDVPTIARYCLGADARSATPAQMQAYIHRQQIRPPLPRIRWRADHR